MLQLLSLGADFVQKSRVANEAAIKFAKELSKREYSRLLFTNAYPELGDLSAELVNFSEFLHRVAEMQGVSLTALEDGFLKSVRTFVHDDLADVSLFAKDTWSLGSHYDQALGKSLERHHDAWWGLQIRLAIAASYKYSRQHFGLYQHEHQVPTNTLRTDEEKKHIVDTRMRFELSRFEIVKYLNQVC